MALTAGMSQTDLAHLWQRLTTPIYLQVGSSVAPSTIAAATAWPPGASGAKRPASGFSFRGAHRE